MKAPVATQDNEVKLGNIESSASLPEPRHITGKIVSKQASPDRSDSINPHSLAKTFKIVDIVKPEQVKIIG